MLSVRLEDPATGDPSVKHYRIKRLDNGAGYYISPKKMCSDLFDLIDFYSGRQSWRLFHDPVRLVQFRLRKRTKKT